MTNSTKATNAAGYMLRTVPNKSHLHQAVVEHEQVSQRACTLAPANLAPAQLQHLKLGIVLKSACRNMRETSAFMTAWRLCVKNMSTRYGAQHAGLHAGQAWYQIQRTVQGTASAMQGLLLLP
jgi:hypothetical protein